MAAPKKAATPPPEVDEPENTPAPDAELVALLKRSLIVDPPKPSPRLTQARALHDEAGDHAYASAHRHGLLLEALTLLALDAAEARA